MIYLLNILIFPFCSVKLPEGMWDSLFYWRHRPCIWASLRQTSNPDVRRPLASIVLIFTGWLMIKGWWNFRSSIYSIYILYNGTTEGFGVLTWWFPIIFSFPDIANERIPFDHQILLAAHSHGISDLFHGGMPSEPSGRLQLFSLPSFSFQNWLEVNRRLTRPTWLPWRSFPS